MDSNTVHQVVKKLVGKVRPLGIHEEDSVRYNNLKVLVALVDALLIDIDEVVAEGKGRQEASVKRITSLANNFLTVRVKQLIEP